MNKKWFLALTVAACLLGSRALAQTDVQVTGNVASTVDPANSTLDTDKSSTPADGTTVILATAIIRDQTNQVLPNRQVTITSSRGLTVDDIRCYSGSVLTTSNTGTTDSQGKVVCAVTSATAGTTTLTATVDGKQLNDQPSVTFSEVISPPPPPNPPTPPGSGTPPSSPSNPEITQNGPPPPPSLAKRIGTQLKKTLGEIPALAPGGLGLLTLIPSIILVPISSGISIALMAGLPAIQYLFLALWPGLRSPRRWGVVKDASTNVPLPGIFVELMDTKSNQRLKRVMTDRTGRFGFLSPKSGAFYVQITNPLYQSFKTESFDVATLAGKPITFDIYLKPIEAARVKSLQHAARFMHILAAVQIIQLITLVLGSIVALALLVNAQATENYLLAILYALLWVFRFISTANYRQSGHIIEKSTDNSINEAIVQVTALKKGEREFIHSTISDESGRFLILVPPGKYDVIATKESFLPTEKQVSGEIQSVEMNLDRVPDQSAAGQPA